MPSSERKWIVHNLAEGTETAAAIEIQRQWKGYRVRKKVRNIFDRLYQKLKLKIPDFEKAVGLQKPAFTVKVFSSSQSTDKPQVKESLQEEEVSIIYGDQKLVSPDPSQTLPLQEKHQQYSISPADSAFQEASQLQCIKNKEGNLSIEKKVDGAIEPLEAPSTINPPETPSALEPTAIETPETPESKFHTETRVDTISKKVQSTQPETDREKENILKESTEISAQAVQEKETVIEVCEKLSSTAVQENLDSSISRESKLDPHLTISTVPSSEPVSGSAPAAVKDSESSVLVSSSKRKTTLEEEAVDAKRLKMTKKTAARLALDAAFDQYLQIGRKQNKMDELMQFADYCAYRIQNWWLFKHHKFLKRRFAHRLTVIQVKVKDKGPLLDPSPRAQQVKIHDKPWGKREAAICIQKAWRRHIDIQVFRYYRDLINFRNRGDPAAMLRCVNPQEAKLLDAASGATVRFRLAGEKFPPNIYYKIFTHRPIQDLCANSPKDYTKYETKQLPGRHIHNDVAKLPPQDDTRKEHWYQRFENNGWRLVSDRLIRHIRNDPVTLETSKKTYLFDHNKLQRKQDVEKQKKCKKIEWMQKMYKEGMLRARADDPQTIQLIEGAAAGMIATVESQGQDALEDWEVDELLDWTTSLNFDEYFNTWKELATSAGSDKTLEKKRSVESSSSDPYELTVSASPSRLQTSSQSHHTPHLLNGSGSIQIRT